MVSWPCKFNRFPVHFVNKMFLKEGVTEMLNVRCVQLELTNQRCEQMKIGWIASTQQQQQHVQICQHC